MTVKNIKKYFATLLVISMIITSIPLNSIANDDQSFTISSGSGYPDDVVSLTVQMNDVKDLKGIQGTINYDADSFELATIDEDRNGQPDGVETSDFTDLWNVNIHNEFGYVNFLGVRTIACDNVTPVRPVIMILNFKIKESAVNGDYSITLTNCKAAKTNGIPQLLGSSESGTITITGGAEKSTSKIDIPKATLITPTDDYNALSSFPTETNSITAPYFGDVTIDGLIDISDVVVASEISSGSAYAYTPEQIYRANVSSPVDLTVDIADVIMIAEKVSGYSSSFPNPDPIEVSLNNEYSDNLIAGSGKNYYFTTTNAGDYTIYTTGSVNTYGYLYDSTSSHVLLASGDDYGSDTNFRLEQSLEENTLYYIRLIGSTTATNGDFSIYVESIAEPALPQNFDASASMPAGWSSAQVSGIESTWSITASPTMPICTSYSSPNCAKFNSRDASSGNSSRLSILSGDGIDIPAGNIVSSSFYMYHDTALSTLNDRVQLQYSADGGLTWVNIGAAVSRYSTSAGWQQHTFVLTDVSGSDVLFGLLGTSENGYNIFVDNIEIVQTVPALPQNFDTNVSVPDGWTSSSVSGTQAQWSIVSNPVNPACTPYSSPNCAKFNSYEAAEGNSARLNITSANGFDIASGYYASVSFCMYHDSARSTINDQIQLQYSTDGGSTWSNVGEHILRYSSTIGWQQHTIKITGITNTDVLIGFLGTSQLGNNMYIDNIAVTIEPTVLPQNFDLSTSMPSGWQSTPVSGTDSFWTVSGPQMADPYCSAFSPKNAVTFNSYDAWPGSSARLSITNGNGIKIESGQIATITFKMYHNTSSTYKSYADRIQLQYSLDSGVTWNSIGDPILRYNNCSTDGWQQHKVSLIDNVGGGIRGGDVLIGMLGISEQGMNIHIDNISVELSTSINVLPQNFDDSTSLPNGWSYDTVMDTDEETDIEAIWAITDDPEYPEITAYSGGNCAFLNSHDAAPGHSARLYTTPGYGINIPSGNYANVTFQMYSNDGDGLSRVQIQYSTNGGTTWTNAGGAISNKVYQSPGWYQHTVQLSGAAGSDVLIGILGISDDMFDEIYIDDIAVALTTITLPSQSQPALPQAFDIPPSVPNGWQTTPIVGSTNWSFSALECRSIERCASYSSFATGDQARLSTTVGNGVTVLSGHQLIVNFFLMMYPYTRLGTDTIQVQYSTNGGTTWINAGSPISTYLNNVSDFRLKSVTLSNVPTGSNVLIGFLATENDGNPIYIDDVYITQEPI